MIRVLRLIEYTYPDVKTMERDIGNWYVPANGNRYMGFEREIRSAILTDFDYKKVDNDE